MLKYIARRLTLLVVVVIGVTLMTFTLMHLAPGDPAEMIAITTMVGLQLGHLLEGAVIVESIFAWPGIGKLLVDSIFARDFSMIQGCVLLFAVVFVIVNLLVDISYVYLCIPGPKDKV